MAGFELAHRGWRHFSKRITSGSRWIN